MHRKFLQIKVDYLELMKTVYKKIQNERKVYEKKKTLPNFSGKVVQVTDLDHFIRK